MKKPPPFEARNYPEQKKSNAINIGLALIASGVALIYIGHHFYAGCTDWGFLQACSVISK